MKKALLLLQILLASGVIAQDALIDYVEGEVDVKTAGELVWAEIGQELQTGDSVITAGDGYAELSQDANNIIRISPDTVFQISEIEEGGVKQPVFACALGSVAFKFQKVVGSEPKISSPSVAAGVRGTEFKVYTAEDGSSMILVDQGLVTVSSQGSSVDLGPTEGVEVVPGEAPGAKFNFLGKELDYSQWNEEKFSAFLRDPQAAALNIEKRLASYIGHIQELLPVFDEYYGRLQAEREKLNSIRESQGDEAFEKYKAQVIFPLMEETAIINLNIRYYALSALSLKRYILGRMYLVLKTRYITDLGNKKFSDFLAIYERILKKFEQEIAPRLNRTDI